MSRPKSKDEDKTKFSKPNVRVKIFVREDMIGAGKIELLKLVGEAGSISGAAAKMGLNYRRAWFLLDTLQRGFVRPLYVTKRGGVKSGGAELTDFGRELIARFETNQSQISKASQDLLSWLETEQKE